MTPVLTEDQRRALAEHPGEPIRLIDPATNRAYVLLPVDLYEQLQATALDDPRDAYPAIDRAFAEGWSDPKLDDYDRYDELRK